MSATAQQKTAEPSMEEILASIRRIISDDQPAAAEIAKPVSVMPAAEPEPPAISEEEDVLDLTSPMAPPAPPPVVQQASPSPSSAPAPVQPMAQAPAVYAQPEPPMAEALISHTTDAAVANAFGSLAHTVLTQNARTIDDVVKDMLRPMLKVWLDDNLPGIVERLVRAEIERVARGGR